MLKERCGVDSLFCHVFSIVGRGHSTYSYVVNKQGLFQGSQQQGATVVDCLMMICIEIGMVVCVEQATRLKTYSKDNRSLKRPESVEGKK